jgi:hypothetical protein
MLTTQAIVFGHPFTTPYSFHDFGRGASLSAFDFSAVPRRFVDVFLLARNGTRVSEAYDPILRAVPALFLVPLGMFGLRRSNRRRLVLWALLIASAIATLMNLAWFAGGGGDIIYSNARFWIAWFPVWTVIGLIALQRLLRFEPQDLRAASSSSEAIPKPSG